VRDTTIGVVGHGGRVSSQALAGEDFRAGRESDLLALGRDDHLVRVPVVLLVEAHLLRRCRLRQVATLAVAIGVHALLVADVE